MATKFVSKRQGLWRDKKAVTPALGVILLMPSLLIAALAAGAMFLDMADWSQAEGDRARFYAECARAETEGLEPMEGCPGYEWRDPPGYSCIVTEDSVYCEKKEVQEDDTTVEST